MDNVPMMRLADPPEPGDNFHFDQKLCCDHPWVFILNEKREPTGSEYCPKCGATCVRDRRTKMIEEYDGVADFMKTKTPQHRDGLFGKQRPPFKKNHRNFNQRPVGRG